MTLFPQKKSFSVSKQYCLALCLQLLKRMLCLEGGRNRVLSSPDLMVLVEVSLPFVTSLVFCFFYTLPEKHRKK